MQVSKGKTATDKNACPAPPIALLMSVSFSFKVFSGIMTG
jgi:hypothetical protein